MVFLKNQSFPKLFTSSETDERRDLAVWERDLCVPAISLLASGPLEGIFCVLFSAFWGM